MGTTIDLREDGLLRIQFDGSDANIVSVSEALQLAAALTERYGGGEWKPAKDAPIDELVWFTDEDGGYAIGKRVGELCFETINGYPDTTTYIRKYQPIIKPAP